MSHTLNEQVVVIPAGTGDVNIELYLSTIVSLTGWTRDGYTVYCDPGKTMGIKFNWTAGSSSCRTEVFCNKTVVMNYIGSFGIAAGTTMRGHKSTDEKVTYFDMGTNSQYELRLVYTVNENGDAVLFQGSGGQNVRTGTTTQSSYTDIYLPFDTTGRKYCISKFPDPLNGYVFASLYVAFGTGSPVYDGQLVSFDGEVYRLVFMSANTNGPVLAFPVSEG